MWRRRECGTGRPEVPRSIDVFVEVSDDGLPVEGGVRVPLVGPTLSLPARRDEIDLKSFQTLSDNTRRALHRWDLKRQKLIKKLSNNDEIAYLIYLNIAD